VLDGAATEGGGPMSIFVDETTKVVVQGLTGSQGKFHGCATVTTEPRSSPA